MSRRMRAQAAKPSNQPDLFSLGTHTPAPSQPAVSHQGAAGELKPERTPQQAPQPSVVRPAAEPRSKHLLDVRAAAAWLGLSKSTLDKMRCYGTGPRYIRATCRAVRYDPDDLRAYAEARGHSPAS